MTKVKYITMQLNLLPIFFIFLYFSSCAGRSLDARGREELKYSKIVSTESSERELFVEAVKAYDDRQYNNCSQNLEILLHNYPDGEFQEAAKLKLIDAKFHSANFPEVVKLVDEFIDLYPEAEALPYLLTLAGASYAETYGGIGRDPTPLLEAKKYYEQIVSEYPDSDYFLSAERELRKINQTLVAYQGYLVDYYKKQQLPVAAQVREQKQVELKSKVRPSMVKKRIVPEGLPVNSVR